MEQQKVLIIIVSATLFLAAVLGIGLALFYPDSGRAQQASARSFEPIEYAREAEPEEPTRDEESVVVYGDGGAGEDEVEVESVPEERVILLTEDEESTDPEAEAADSEEITTRPARPSVARRSAGRESPQRAPEPSRAEPEPETPAAPAQSAAYRAAPEPEVRRIRVTEHWIQLISSPHRERVDAVRAQLTEEYSLGARLTTKEIGDTIYYRLRVGPYDDRGEAEKFLAWIRDIDGFGEAYISEEYPLRTVR